MKKILVVGLGGTGSCVISPLVRFITHSELSDLDIFLMDGDSYEDKNRDRQEFVGGISLNKAENWKVRLSTHFPEVPIKAYPFFLNATNIEGIIVEDSVVMSCVDNHATRKLIQDRCSRLKNICFISSGNELYDGNVQVFIKENGKAKTPTIYEYHQEIEWPEDKSPEDMSCEELAESSPQLLFANFMSASLMLCAFYNYVMENDVSPEVYFDITKQACKPCKR